MAGEQGFVQMMQQFGSGQQAAPMGASIQASNEQMQPGQPSQPGATEVAAAKLAPLAIDKGVGMAKEAISPTVDLAGAPLGAAQAAADAGTNVANAANAGASIGEAASAASAAAEAANAGAGSVTPGLGSVLSVGKAAATGKTEDIGGAVGSIAGGAAGSTFGPLGTAVGSTLGKLAGSYFGKAF